MNVDKKLFTRKNCEELYYTLAKVRYAEEGIAEKYPEGKMRCPTHLSIGQECVPAASKVCLRTDDYAVSTHRGHAHYLGKGGDLKKMYAEIYGKVTGCSRGKGGSMHLIDTSVGFMGTTAIVGNSIPVGVGFALSFKIQKTSQISVIYFGDGAVEEGAFYESANFAAVQKLPVLFVCENNLYSVYSHLRSRQPEGRNIHKMVQEMGLQVDEGDGNSILTVTDKMQKAVDYVRSGKGPAFLEFYTYRWREHCGPFYDNHIGYRTEEEFQNWKKRDPLVVAQQELKTLGMSDADFKKIEDQVHGEVKVAFEFAEQSPFPEPEETWMHLYANPIEL